MKKNILLVACGSFNPVTNMHMRLFELARDALHKTGLYNVLSGIISPTNDGYKKQGLISSNHRVKMVTLATQTSQWIRVSSWEAEQPCWMETLKVLHHMKSFANESFPGHSNVQVKLLCGADLLESFNVPGLWKDTDIENIVRDYGIVVITRSDTSPQQFIDSHKILLQCKENISIVEEWIPNEISATKIRKAISENESIKYLVPDSVIEYIKEHNLYQ